MDKVNYGYEIKDGKPTIESLEELTKRYHSDFISTGNFEFAVSVIQIGINNLTNYFYTNYDSILNASKGNYDHGHNYVYKFLTCYSNIWQYFAYVLVQTDRFGSGENAAFMAGTILPVELSDAQKTMSICENIRGTAARLSGNPLTEPILNVTRNFTELSASVIQCMDNLNSMFR